MNPIDIERRQKQVNEDYSKLDNSILTVSTWALALSISVLGTFEVIQLGSVLLVSWLCLAVGIILCLISQCANYIGQLMLLGKVKRGERDANIGDWHKPILVVNGASLLATLLGICLLVWFGIGNLEQKRPDDPARARVTKPV